MERSNQSSPYEDWLAKRRAATPAAGLADQVMKQVAELDRQRHGSWWLRMMHRIERSRAARWAVCGGALAIGGLPFLFLAHVARL